MSFPGLLALLAVLSLMVPPLSASAATTTRPPGDSGPATVPTISLSQVTPTIARPGDTVHVSVRVRNDGHSRLAAGDVALVLPGLDLARRSDVTDWASGTDPVQGRTLATSKVPSLAPGDSVLVDLAASGVAELKAARYGAVPVSVQSADVGLHTFLGYERRKEYVPLDVSWIVPITLDASSAMFGQPGATRLDAWRRALGPSSRVSRLLDATQDRPVTWALDPTLVEPPPAPAPDEADTTGSDAGGGGTSDTQTPTPSPSTTPLDEERRLRESVSERIRQEARAHGPVLLPDADADVATSYRNKQPSPLLAGQVDRATRLVTGLGGRADIAWPVTPPTTHHQRARLSAIYPSGTRPAVILPASVLPSTIFTPDAAAQESDGSLLLAFDDRLSAIASRTSTPEDGALAAQELIAASVSLLNERPGTSRHVLIALPRGFSPDAEAFTHLLDAAEQTPWMADSPLDDVVTAAEQAVPVRIANPSDATAPQGGDSEAILSEVDPLGTRRALLTPRSTAAISADSTAITAMSEIRNDGDQFRATWQETARQLTSVRWRAAPSQWRRTRSTLHQKASSSNDGLEVSAGAVNFFAESGRLQVTVANKLDVGVHDVRVRLTPDNPRLRLETQPDPIEIGPGSRSTVSAQATALAAGDVPVTIRMLTADGTQVGHAATLDVRVSPTGDWIYWVVGGLAAVLLVLGVWRTLRRERRPRGGR